MKALVVAWLAVTAAVLAGLAACGGRPPAPGTAPAATPAPDGSRTAAARTPGPSAPPATQPGPGRVADVRPITGWLAGKDWTFIPTTRMWWR